MVGRVKCFVIECCLLGIMTGSSWAAPIVQITSLPAYGVNGSMQGVVSGVTDFSAYRVAPYIQIEGSGWWTKPTAELPTVPINPDGTFSANVTTGGIDNRATIYYAALVPAETTPPIALGVANMPVLNQVASAAKEQYSKTVRFAGYDWAVKESPQPVGPGANVFSNAPSNVWVDSQGLHLRIDQHDGKWWSSEAFLTKSLGYGTYTFQTKGPVDQLDPNVTFGAFTWDAYGNETSGASANREIDFEDGRWGKAAETTNAQEVVQPYTTAGNLHRYTMPTLGAESIMTRSFTWKPGEVDFKATMGEDAFSQIIDQWNYVQDPSANHYVPTSGNERIHLNLWLNNVDQGDVGLPAPALGQPVEVLITNFHFEPLPEPSTLVLLGAAGAMFFFYRYGRSILRRS